MATTIRVDSFESYFPTRTEAYGQVARDTALHLDLSRVGPLLQQARIKKSLSLDQVADSLFIRKSTLQAIESGYGETLPHAVYVKGYIKLYASYLNISGDLDGDGSSETDETFRVNPPEPSQLEERPEPAKARTMNRIVRKVLLMCSSLILFTVAFAFFPGPPTPSSATGLREVSVGFFDADHAITHVRKVMIPYSDRPWLNPFATAGETRTIILDLPDTDPMTHNNPPTESTRNEG